MEITPFFKRGLKCLCYMNKKALTDGKFDVLVNFNRLFTNAGICVIVLAVIR